MVELNLIVLIGSMNNVFCRVGIKVWVEIIWCHRSAVDILLSRFHLIQWCWRYSSDFVFLQNTLGRIGTPIHWNWLRSFDGYQLTCCVCGVGIVWIIKPGILTAIINFCPITVLANLWELLAKDRLISPVILFRRSDLSSRKVFVTNQIWRKTKLEPASGRSTPSSVTFCPESDVRLVFSFGVIVMMFEELSPCPWDKSTPNKSK